MILKVKAFPKAGRNQIVGVRNGELVIRVRAPASKGEANKELITRAQSLTVGGTVKIRMCKIAAEGQGFAPEDLHGFVELVPMGDAEIVRLQNEEAHAYMR